MKILLRHTHLRGEVIFMTSLCVLTLAILHNLNYLVDVITIPELFQCTDDISCYGEKTSNTKRNSFPSSAVFIISSSCSNTFSVYESCALESITRGVTNNLYVLVTNPLKYNISRDSFSDDDYSIKGYQSFQNIIHKIDIYDFVKDTPLDGIFIDSFLNNENRHKVVREVLKLAALYRFGGVVIDLDMLVTEPAKLSDMFGVNGAAKIGFGALGGAILALDRKTEIGEAIFNKIFEILNTMSIDENLDVGVLVTKAYLAVCSRLVVQSCRDFNIILKTERFYPLNFTENHKYFEEGDLIPNVYGYYLWYRREILPKPKSLYWNLMKKYCPHVHSLINSKINGKKQKK